MSLLKSKKFIIVTSLHFLTTAILLGIGLLSFINGTLGSSSSAFSLNKLIQVLIWLLSPLTGFIWSGYLEGWIKMNPAIGLLLFISSIIGSLFFAYIVLLIWKKAFNRSL
tara:strand:+ start:369 stop:698 length:330 start_codon:yes stop_codon:yes gene_type:complete